MENISLLVVFAGLLLFFLVISETVKAKLIGKVVDFKVEREKMKKGIPASILMVAIGIAVYCLV